MMFIINEMRKVVKKGLSKKFKKTRYPQKSTSKLVIDMKEGSHHHVFPPTIIGFRRRVFSFVVYVVQMQAER